MDVPSIIRLYRCTTADVATLGWLLDPAGRLRADNMGRAQIDETSEAKGIPCDLTKVWWRISLRTEPARHL
jgi:hypothetical protein